MIPRVNKPDGIQTPDYIFRGEKWDLKEIKGNSRRTIDYSIKKHKNQAQNFVLDVINSNLSILNIKEQIEILYGTAGREWVNAIILKQGHKLICIYKRKRDYTSDLKIMQYFFTKKLQFLEVILIF